MALSGSASVEVVLVSPETSLEARIIRGNLLLGLVAKATEFANMAVPFTGVREEKSVREMKNVAVVDDTAIGLRTVLFAVFGER